jgi:hypothetical protein
MRSATILAPRNGPRIPTSPAVLLARKILLNGPPAIGAYPCVGFMTLKELEDYLGQFEITVFFDKAGAG